MNKALEREQKMQENPIREQSIRGMSREQPLPTEATSTTPWCQVVEGSEKNLPRKLTFEFNDVSPHYFFKSVVKIL